MNTTETTTKKITATSLEDFAAVKDARFKDTIIVGGVKYKVSDSLFGGTSRVLTLQQKGKVVGRLIVSLSNRHATFMEGTFY